MDHTLDLQDLPNATAPARSRGSIFRALLAAPQRMSLLPWASRWGMTMLVLTLLCALWAAFFWFSAQQKRSLMVDRGVELGLISNAVAQHSATLLTGIGHDLRMLDVWLETNPGANPLIDTRFIALVDEMRRSAGGVIDIRMVAADGSLFYLPCPDGVPRANVSDREYVTFHQSGPGAEPRSMHVSAPVRSRVTDHWDIPVSLRMSPVAAQGASPAGAHGPLVVLFAAVSLNSLVAEHERMRFKPDGAISLVRTDGIVLSRAPMLAPYIGQDISGSKNFGNDIGYGQSPRGSFVSNGELTDGIARLVSFERLRDFPITVLVSRSMQDVYAAYDSRRQASILLGVGFSAVLLVIIVALQRSQTSHKTLRLMQADLRRMATTDELTGLSNRRAFMEAAGREFERAKRYARPTAVLMLDIDHFKTINDRFGHSAGDQVLKACAACWQATLRDQDLLGRIGGEEFCILLPETSAADAAHIGERLRRRTGSTEMLGGRSRVSVSVGWTVMQPEDACLAVTLERCDASLYSAKRSGRDRVHPVVATPARPTDSFYGTLPA